MILALLVRIVAPLAQGLQVALIPEQNQVALVRLDVIHNRDIRRMTLTHQEHPTTRPLTTATSTGDDPGADTIHGMAPALGGIEVAQRPVGRGRPLAGALRFGLLRIPEAVRCGRQALGQALQASHRHLD